MKTRIRGLLIVVLALLTGVIASPARALTINEIQKLLASDGAAFDDFGVTIAVDGDTAVIGARLNDDDGLDSGSAYVFTRTAGVWTEQQKLTASDGAASDQFGLAVAVDGDTVVIGAEADDDDGSSSGSAYVFTRSAGVWTEQQKLTASDAATGDWFGSSVAVAGDTAIIGAEREDENGSNSGSAYVFTRSAGVWTEQQKLTASDGFDFDDFGDSMAIDGDTAVIGARFGDLSNLFAESDFGAAYVFTSSFGVWTEQQKLIASDGAKEDQFGFSVSVDGDTAVIGARLDEGDTGAAYVFTRSAGVWTEQQKLTASDGAAGHEFGYSVAVGGDTAVIGAWMDNDNGDESGSAYRFTRSAGVWSEQAKLIASDIAAFDHFGQAVAMSGGTTVVGATRDDDKGSASGSAYVFSQRGFNAVVGLADLNNNGSPDVAVLVEAASSHVHIRDGSTDALISDIDFGDDPVSAMVVIDDISGNGMPEIALLGTRPNNNVRVQVKDSQTGATVNNIFYGTAFSAVDMTVLPDTNSNGADELLVVGADGGGGVRAQARDALTDAETSTTFYGNKVPPIDVVTIPDISTNGEPEVLMHGQVTASGQVRAQMRDSATKALLRNFFFGTVYSPIQLTVIDDVSGDGIQDLAQLGKRDDTGAVRIQTKRTDTGATVANAFTGSTSVPIAIVGIGDANGNSAPDVAMLVREPDGTAKVIVRDGATGAFIRNTFAASVSNPVAMALIDDLNSSGTPELLVLGDDGAGTKRVQIKDSITGAQVNTINYP
jgi:hypothetical protein